MLLGGISHINGFDTVLQQELDVDVIHFNPFTNVSLASGLEIPKNYGVYANAIGLAVRGLTDK